MSTTEVPGRRCPACAAAGEMTTSLYEDATPKPGDVSICIGCAAVLLFGPDLASVVPNAEQKLALLRSPAWPEIRRAVRAVVRAKGGKP